MGLLRHIELYVLILPIIQQVFASDPRFTDFTQSGVMVMGQRGTPWVTATDATEVMVR